MTRLDEEGAGGVEERGSDVGPAAAVCKSATRDDVSSLAMIHLNLGFVPHRLAQGVAKSCAAAGSYYLVSLPDKNCADILEECTSVTMRRSETCRPSHPTSCRRPRHVTADAARTQQTTTPPLDVLAVACPARERGAERFTY